MSENLHNFDNDPNSPLNNNGEFPFGLPSDYFSKFEGKVRQKLELENELEVFPILSSIQKYNSFTIPLNYFSKTENVLEYQAELSSYTTLKNIKPLVFDELNSEYANHLQSSLKHKIEFVEELQAYQTLCSIDKKNSFNIPASYFDGVSDSIKDKIYSKTENKIPALHLLIDFVFAKKLAFTFGLVTIITLSIYFYKSPEKTIELGDCKTLACLEKQEILNNNKAISNFDEDQLMDLVDVNSLNKQLNAPKEKTSTSYKKLNLDSINEDDLLEEL